MGRGGRVHHRYVPPPPEPVPQGVGGIRAQGSAASCGCPCCHNGSQIVFERTLPVAFADVYTQEEWTAMVREIDRILDELVMPIFPCIFTHFCLPFSPVCAMLCYASKQKKALGALIAQENKRLEPQGLYWTHTPNRAAVSFGAFMCLSWRPDVRPAWEAANPSRRPISREPLPAEFYSPELKMAVAMAQVQAQALMLNQGGAGVQMVPVYGAGAAVAPGAQPAQGYGQQAWGQPPPQPPLPAAAYPPGGAAVRVQAAPQQQSMGGPSSPSAVGAPAAQPWSASAPMQQPQWSPPPPSSHVGNSYAVAATPDNTTEGYNSSQQQNAVVKRFCAGCGAPRGDLNARFCAACGTQQ